MKVAARSAKAVVETRDDVLFCRGCIFIGHHAQCMCLLRLWG
jgi:hypothetical protein